MSSPHCVNCDPSCSFLQPCNSVLTIFVTTRLIWSWLLDYLSPHWPSAISGIHRLCWTIPANPLNSTFCLRIRDTAYIAQIVSIVDLIEMQNRPSKSWDKLSKKQKGRDRYSDTKIEGLEGYIDIIIAVSLYYWSSSLTIKLGAEICWCKYGCSSQMSSWPWRKRCRCLHSFLAKILCCASIFPSLPDTSMLIRESLIEMRCVVPNSQICKICSKRCWLLEIF